MSEGSSAVAELQDLRSRVLAGEEVSAAEYEKVLTALRADRRSSARTVKGPKAKQEVTKLSAAEAMSILSKGLDGL